MYFLCYSERMGLEVYSLPGDAQQPPAGQPVRQGGAIKALPHPCHLDPRLHARWCQQEYRLQVRPYFLFNLK